MDVEGSSLKAIVLAAGEGIRLRPFTDRMPKGMISVGNKPILSYVIESLVSSGISEIVLVVGYQKERIMDYFKDGALYHAHITYVVQDRQLGTGHALLKAAQSFGTETLVVPADNLVNSVMIASIKDQMTPSVLCVLHDEPSNYGVVEIEDGRLKNIYEKPQSDQGNIISTGIYKLPKEMISVLKKMVDQGRTDLTDTIKEMISEGFLINALLSHEPWQDVVYPWDIIQVNENIMQQKDSMISEGTIEKGVVIKGPVIIGKNTIVRSGSYLLGPVSVGDGCHIGPSTCLFPSTTVGDQVTIGPFTSIHNCVIMANSSIDSHCCLKQSIIGEGCRLGSNIITLEADEDIRLDTSTRFHHVKRAGCYIGENTCIDAAVVIHPGILIGSDTVVGSQKVITKPIKSNSMVV
jgi:UDP-N-acetylglucosamine diphosphorylase / glucose-1-phosphate thymidylyltransferase / UDP-N-acetylgalactosamine diphosphorylase / glucosamine-1-phosphate N-acetyltransferase / galactosamine-1-phosphate N-acetyltransferase